MPPWATKIAIMTEMHWDYWTYRRQPVWVINEMLLYLETKAKAEKDKMPKGV